VSSQSPKALDSLRVRVRRLQFIVGLGFLAMILGRLLTNLLWLRLEARLVDLPVGLQQLTLLLLPNLWLFSSLPLICYGAALILDLKPLSTSVGASLTGAVFLGLISFVSMGFEGLWEGWMAVLLQFTVFLGGVAVTYRAVVSGRAAAARAAAKAQAQAQARKAEYVEFLREAERGADKIAQREAESASVVASSGSGATVAVAPEVSAPVAVEVSPAPVASVEPSAPSTPPAETKAPTTEG
jgi:hypothetical protein